MIEYSQQDLILALKNTGLKKGDIILVSTELFKLGKLKGVNTKEEYSKIILDALFEVIGEKGTVVVNAFTTYVGRYGKPFDYKKSYAITGGLSEYILFHPESVRSLHPINSVAAIGYHKNEICRNVSTSNYGIDSAFDRLLKKNCQVLRLGIDYVHNSFLHVVETLYGLPYVYNKILDSEIIIDGEISHKQFFASVRYLDYPFEYSLNHLKEVLDQSGCVHRAKLGAGFIYRLDANEYCDILISLLKENPYAFLEGRPAFIKGQIPWDGITAGRDAVPASADYK